jgi:hypothetical protein
MKKSADLSSILIDILKIAAIVIIGYIVIRGLLQAAN